MFHDDMISLLDTNNIGDFGTDFFWGTMPSSPDDLMAAYDGPGPAGLYTKKGSAQSEVRLQVLCRSTSYGGAMGRAMSVYTFLDNRRWVAGLVRYYVRAVQRPFDVGATDEADRTIISCNYAITLKAS